MIEQQQIVESVTVFGAVEATERSRRGVMCGSLFEQCAAYLLSKLATRAGLHLSPVGMRHVVCAERLVDFCPLLRICLKVRLVIDFL